MTDSNCIHIVYIIIDDFMNYSNSDPVHALLPCTYRNPEYRAYKNSTPPLIPFVPSLYKKMNKWVKLIFCCEFPFYTIDTDKEEEVQGEKQPAIKKDLA